MPEIIECPSGLAGEIRGLKVKEFNILANRRLAKSGGQIDAMLSACWTETMDPGPYNFGDKTIDWDKVLQGDRFYALLKIRALSLGNTYPFGAVCQGEACRHRFEWEIALDDLPVRKLSEESRECFQNGNRFETRLPGAGSQVWFRLAIGADERRFTKVRQANRDRLWSAMLALRVLEIEEVKESDRRRFLEELEVADAEFLRGEFDRVDCGVDTTIEIECPECWAVQDIDLPFDQRFFLGTQRKERGGPPDFSPR